MRKVGEQLIRHLSDEQRDTMIRNYLSYRRRADLVPEVGLTGEQKKQLEAAVKEKDDAKRAELVAPFVRELSIDQKDELLLRLWRGPSIYRTASN